MIREDGKLPYGLELFIGERINEALQDSEARKRRYCEAGERLRREIGNKHWRLVNTLLEEMLELGYEDTRSAYFAGIEDGIRLTRKIFTV